MNSQNKKGMTIVEVVIALSLITIVFAGAANLIVQVVHFSVEVRERTVGTALAQEKIADAVKGSNVGCSINLPGDTTATVQRNNTTYSILTKQPVRVSETGGSFNNDNTGKFIKYRVEVTWNSNPNPIIVEQINRIKN